MNDDRIIQGLEQDARLVEERMHNVMDDAKIKEVGLQLKKYLRVNALTQSDVAREIGISAALVSQFCAGKYKGDGAEIAKKAIAYMNTKAMQRRNKHRVPEFIETTVARRIFTAIRHTEAFSGSEEAKICMIIGDAGHGKSKCLQEYAKLVPNTLYVPLDDTMSSKGIFTAIAKAMNGQYKTKIDIGRPQQAMIEQLVEACEFKLMSVILDEASGLKVKHLNQLRQILCVRAKRPLVISGNNQLLHTINQDVTRCGNESLDQFRSRLLSVVDLDKLAIPDRDGGGRLYTNDDIRSLYEQLGVKLSSDAVLTLRMICQTPQTGRLRTCHHIMAAICMSPEVKAGQTVDADYIFAAIKQLGLPIMDRLPFTYKDVVEQDHRNAAVKTA